MNPPGFSSTSQPRSTSRFSRPTGLFCNTSPATTAGAPVCMISVLTVVNNRRLGEIDAARRGALAW
ncbi:hypothetical protein ACFWJW_21215 [Streptomyces sp. NPDC127097]|uniref:hypothetical protein n=1 Tax=Streptomyces sp. NPDC127097 TaxID=3347136 RepID=UPI003665CA94